jgi:ppGpp synthetase/RelA/SpoT-type nucleotidyltranferase
MTSKKSFFIKYEISEKNFEATGITWEQLEEIYTDYEMYKKKLQRISLSIVDTLMSGPNVHSVRYRIKEGEHLIEKIIRKRIKDPERIIDITNYKVELDDLLGLRIIHLFKRDWEAIDAYIRSEYDIKGTPIANYRKGDLPEIIDAFKAKKCDPKEHPKGYRSVHYTITFSPGKETMQAEIQVRTIFEEGWSEIDHTVRYPYKQGDLVLEAYLSLLNRAGSMADEMSTFIPIMDSAFEERNKKINDQQGIITDLKKKVEKLQVQPDQLQEKENISREILRLEESNRHQRLSPNLITSSMPIFASGFTNALGSNSSLYDLATKNIQLTSFQNFITSPLATVVNNGQCQVTAPSSFILENILQTRKKEINLKTDSSEKKSKPSITKLENSQSPEGVVSKIKKTSSPQTKPNNKNTTKSRVKTTSNNSNNKKTRSPK